jgi:uncharacterized cupin superfamily protein
MPQTTIPMAIDASEVPPRDWVSSYPEPFAARMDGRQKRQLGEFFGLQNFGVNLTRLAPGAISSLRHAHTKQDEFVYIVRGRPTLHTNEGRLQLAPGMCAGFRAGTGNAHHLCNDTSDEVLYLEIGDRMPGDEVTYPEDDLRVVRIGGKGQYVHKDGTPY